MNVEAWPELDYEQWAPTKKTLQMCAQMLGKLRLALAPPQPEWLHTCLYLDARGFATGPMPCGDRVITAALDVFDSALVVRSSDGGSATVAIGPERCIAEIWGDLARALAGLDVDADIWEKPQELADTTLFSENRDDCTFDVLQAQRFHRLLCTVDGVYEEFRSTFFGRTSIQYWWGASDFAVLLFTGKQLVAPDDRGYIMRYDLDAEHYNAGFWPGDDSSPTPIFYGYLVPRPDGCEVAPMEPEHAGWVEAMGEWVLPYEAVRTAPDPREALLGFLRAVYRVAITHGGWDARQFEYVTPAPARRD